ncbi:MAG: SDR family oxidoreductase [Calditrichaceae bacterium]|nr:SDR family oxidoreductase [Calditrichaceae bacterium]MBN2710718.1 SDR family oxidoreductase [Calditrichaceae bacterium]RQV92747.1 MAG: SDR family oxidoreductase [Calditrichota bacterium]
MKTYDKICLITGASSGIGYALANALKDDGYRLILTARREERLATLKCDQVDIYPGDLTKPGFIEVLEDFVFNKFGKCDILINNAGMIMAEPIETFDIEKMTAMLRLNIEAAFRLTYLFLKRFKIQGHGHVVNISSVLGTKVRSTAGAYSATKFAIEALSEALRLELVGSDIHISCIEPGLVLTELHDDWPVHPREGMGIHTPLKPEDIVEAVRYILKQPGYVRIPKLMILPKDHNI